MRLPLAHRTAERTHDRVSIATVVAVVAVVTMVAILAGGCKPNAGNNTATPEDTRGMAADRDAMSDDTDAAVRDVDTEPFNDTGDVDRRVVAEIPQTIDQLNDSGVLATVYFEFDSSELSDEARETLQANAAWLKANVRYSVRVEGHCDERGTIEYNLALGERRARILRDYLTSLGVDAGRLRIVSYGEEKPAVAGRDESAMAQNRRGEFIIES